MHDHRQDIQDHIQPVAKDQQDDSQDDKHEMTEQRSCQFVDRCGNCRACKADRPKGGYRRPMSRKNVYDPKQYRYNIDQTGQNGFQNTAFVVGEHEAQNETQSDKSASDCADGDPAEHKPEGENLGTDDQAQYDIINTSSWKIEPISPSILMECRLRTAHFRCAMASWINASVKQKICRF